MRYTRILFVILLAVICSATASAENGAVTVKVDSTNLATLNNIMDILDQIPGVRYSDGEIVVDGIRFPTSSAIRTTTLLCSPTAKQVRQDTQSGIHVS